MRSQISLLTFRTNPRKVAKVLPAASDDTGGVRTIIELAPVLGRINPSGLATTIRLMRNLIDPPELSGADGDARHTLASVSAHFAFLNDAKLPRQRRRPR